MARRQPRAAPRPSNALEPCRHCGEPIPWHVRSCPQCEQDAGYPNVRAAQCPAEVAALNTRIKDAETSANARNCEQILRDFGKAVAQSNAVICRSLSVVKALVETETSLYSSFYSQVAGGARVPEDNMWERGRMSVDATLFPLYAEKIIFASLSLDSGGLGGAYGDYAVFLRESFIAHRASVFEENPFAFMQRHSVVSGEAIPAGYRAPWSTRGDLARAKLHSRLAPTTTPAHYPAILCDVSTKMPDFIEVHIFGSFGPKAIAKVVGPKPRSGADAVIARSLAAKLQRLGAEFEETT